MSTMIATMPIRNESWICGLSLRVALMWNDAVVVLLHRCIDESAAIVKQVSKENPGRVLVLVDDSEGWDEMPQRQRMLDWARHNAEDFGATHISLCDCDEILTGNLLGNIREQIARLNTGQMLTLPLYNLRGGLNRYHLNGLWGQRIVSVAFKDVDTASFKGDKFHHREPQGVNWQSVNVVNQGAGGIMHLWGASERRLIAKHAWFKVTERLRWPAKSVAEIDRMYSWAIKGEPGKERSARWGTPETWTYADVPAGWWSAYDYLRAHLKLDDSEPWQATEVRRLVAEHGRERFEGLDLFGLV